MFQLESAHCQLAEARLQLEKMKVDNNDLKRLLVLNSSATDLVRIDLSLYYQLTQYGYAVILLLCSML